MALPAGQDRYRLIVGVQWGRTPVVVSQSFAPNNIMAFNPVNGELLWTATVESQQVYVAIGPNGKVAVGGFFLNFGGSPFFYEAFVSLLDKNGNLLWRTIVVPERGTSSQQVYAVRCDPEGNVVYATSRASDDGTQGKLDAASGGMIWQRLSLDELFFSMVTDRSGNIAGGIFASDGGGDAAKRFTSGGAEVGTYVTAGSDFHTGTAFDDDGNLFIRSGDSLNKYSPSRALLWSAPLGGEDIVWHDRIDTDSLGNCWCPIHNIVHKFSPDGELLTSIMASTSVQTGGILVQCSGTDVTFIRRGGVIGDVFIVGQIRRFMLNEENEYVERWSYTHDEKFWSAAQRWLPPLPPSE